MAFVFGKAKKSTTAMHAQSSPGPGDYHLIDRAQIEASAPFHSSTLKTSSFDVAPTNTGPGSYDPAYQKDLQRRDKSIHMSSCFNSKVERFKTEPHQSNNAGSQKMKVSLVTEEHARYSSTDEPVYSQKEAYIEAISKAKEKMNMLQFANNQRRIDSIGTNRSLVRIVLSNPKNTEVMHSVFIDNSITKKNEGPGSYNIESATDLCKRRTSYAVDWSKNKGKRFNNKKNRNPGPGSYEVQKGPRKSSSALSSSFAYQGLRSCMDEAIYKTKMPFKVKVIEERKLKDRYPGPGSYDPHKEGSKSFHNGYDCFGSTLFPTRSENQEDAGVPGPGAYSLTEQKKEYKEKLKHTRQKLFNRTKIKVDQPENLYLKNKEEVRKQCLADIQRTKNKFYTLKERCNSKAGNFSHAERWNKDKNNTPGPGNYQVLRKKSQSEHKAAPFNSTCQQKNSTEESTYLPFYEIERNDIGQVAMRAKRNIQNLKQIDIEKAPFNSKQTRFEVKKQSQRKQSRNNQSPEMVSWHPHELQDKARERIMKNMSTQQPHPSAAFKSTTKRAWAPPQHIIGPGNYNYPSQMEKKSFNRQYNYNPPLKIRSTYRTRSSLA